MKALITNIKIKETPHDDYRRWSWTEGDPTGRQYDFWIEISDWTDNEFIERVLETMNELIVCSAEKKIRNPFSISFDAKTPRPGEGYDTLATWYGRHYCR